MNFNPELSAFQGAILSADNVHQFSKLTAKGGNEDSIDHVIESLKTFLEESNYIINDNISTLATSQVRKFALYIILNADLPKLKQLIELEEISTLIWTTPTIPKCLMCELLWNLHMERFISEIISFTNPQLALEVAGAFLEHFKYFDPLDCLKELQLLSLACYTLICNLHFFKYESSDLRNKSTTAFNNFQQCLKYYTTPPNNHKLNALRKVELYKYQGKSLYSLLHLIDNCLIQFTSKLDLNLARSDIYKVTYSEENINKECLMFNVCDSSNSILLECLSNANTAMLDTCKVLVMDVSVDVFCCWSEFEENDKTMQQTVGELCYKVHNKIMNLGTLAEHPVVDMLVQISRKPVEMKEKINAVEDKDIIENINNNTLEREAWIKALVHKDKLCQNINLLNIVQSNLDIYDQNESYKLYTMLKQCNMLESENKVFAEALAVKLFDKCDLSKKYVILENHFENKVFVDMNETQEFSNAMTAVFNKFIASPDADLTDILTVFLQNPRQVLMRIFNLASENTQQAQIMLKVMKLLNKFSEHYYNKETEPCIVIITEKMFHLLDTEAKENNFIQFLCGLKNENIIPGTKLLLLIIMTNLHKALLAKDVGSLHMQLKLLKEAYKLQELIQYRAPMLAMLALVLDAVRWQINTFNVNAPNTLHLAMSIVTALLESYKGVIPDNENQWLKSKLKNLKPLNMYYYRVLWNPPGSNYLEIVSGMTITKDMEFESITSWLAQVICSCTQQEWCEIWDSLKIFSNDVILNIIYAAMTRISVAEKSNSTKKSCACILYCYRNFVYITRYKYITEPLTDEQVQTILSKTADLTELVGKENIEDLGTILMPVFAYLTEKQSDYNINLAENLNKYLGGTQLSPMINKVFLNGTS